MKLSAQSAVALLIAYQGWCGEKVLTMYRAEQVIADLTKMLVTHTSKAAASRWLHSEGWSDTVSKPKALVDDLWPLRETVMAEYSQHVAKEIRNA